MQDKLIEAAQEVEGPFIIVAELETENVALRAKVAKLVAPISDEEWASTKTWPKGIWRDNLDTLIAARGREGE